MNRPFTDSAQLAGSFLNGKQGIHPAPFFDLSVCHALQHTVWHCMMPQERHDSWHRKSCFRLALSTRLSARNGSMVELGCAHGVQHTVNLSLRLRSLNRASSLKFPLRDRYSPRTYRVRFVKSYRDR